MRTSLFVAMSAMVVGAGAMAQDCDPFCEDGPADYRFAMGWGGSVLCTPAVGFGSCPGDPSVIPMGPACLTLFGTGFVYDDYCYPNVPVKEESSPGSSAVVSLTGLYLEAAIEDPTIKITSRLTPPGMRFDFDFDALLTASLLQEEPWCDFTNYAYARVQSNPLSSPRLHAAFRVQCHTVAVVTAVDPTPSGSCSWDLLEFTNVSITADSGQDPVPDAQGRYVLTPGGYDFTAGVRFSADLCSEIGGCGSSYVECEAGFSGVVTVDFQQIAPPEELEPAAATEIQGESGSLSVGAGCNQRVGPWLESDPAQVLHPLLLNSPLWHAPAK